METEKIIEKTERNIRQAINDYGKYTDQIEVLNSISSEFIRTLAEDSTYAKQELRELFSKSPVWNEELDALVINGTRTHNPDYNLVYDLAKKMLQSKIYECDYYSERHTQLYQILGFFANPIGERHDEEIEEKGIAAIQAIAPKAYAPGKKLSRIFKAICVELGIADETAGSEFQRLYAQFADELSSKQINFKLYVSINPAHFLTMSNPKNDRRGPWLEHRKKGIGGSDASIVCGINKYKSPVQLWMEKTDQIQPEEAGEAAYWGTLFEDVVKSEFTKRTGIEVVERKELLQSVENSFMFANLDGICEHPTLGTCVFEAKTASAYKAREWEDSIPDEYFLQVQHYLSVTGYKGAYIAVLIGGNTFKWKLIEHDEELISVLIKLEADFWHHIEDLTPPELDGSDACAKFISEKYPNSVPKSQIELSKEADDLIQQYNSACEQLEIYKEKKQIAENQLKEMLGDNEIGTSENNVVTWKSMSRDSFDSRTMKAEHPKLYAKYTNPISYRRFSVRPI